MHYERSRGSAALRCHLPNRSALLRCISNKPSINNHGCFTTVDAHGFANLNRHPNTARRNFYIDGDYNRAAISSITYYFKNDGHKFLVGHDTGSEPYKQTLQQSKMAEVGISQDEFKCPVCLDLLKDPVTIPCGHSCCKSCITVFWDQEDQMKVYSCPQCKQTVSPRPALAENTMLAEVMEKLKKIKLPADCYAGAGDVQCDACTGRKHKAAKSCLECLESYCQNHLEEHESLFTRKRHNLTEATGRLQEMICKTHEKLLEVFCRTDQKCICLLCAMDEHKNHDTVSTAAQRTEKQNQLKETQRLFQQRIQQREKDLQQLREAVESHKRSAQTAVEDTERIFTELIRSIERSCSEATQRIRDQEKTAVSRAEEQLERLEQEINDLRRRDAELEQLSHTQDHIHFLQWVKRRRIPNMVVPDLALFDLHILEWSPAYSPNLEISPSPPVPQGLLDFLVPNSSLALLPLLVPPSLLAPLSPLVTSILQAPAFHLWRSSKAPSSLQVPSSS
ncbi:E3 ubiquitin/ISG15 ligase TRIM25 [Anabarilius grahami]|uniref:E3 ubiquitin/ISG15 ligase TRIM25 n=1 Tax=Anabarilius grahami TaxID=495550 RepID=A0A3N0YYS8_ANAGA|nr:E3 ubiquitin/ISG15 ligase TRIM25 [Anabarilius grahami]